MCLKERERERERKRESEWERERERERDGFVREGKWAEEIGEGESKESVKNVPLICQKLDTPTYVGAKSNSQKKFEEFFPFL